MKKNIKRGLIFIALITAIFTANHCLAIGSLVDTSDPKYATGDYTLNSVRDYAVYIMQLILGLVGTLSLVMFVYGGMTFLLSAGNQNSVKKGMDIIKAAVIGLVLVFSSVLIINLFFGGLGVTWDKESGAVATPVDKCAKSFGSKGYSCMDEANGSNCVSNLCPGAANIKCCKAK